MDLLFSLQGLFFIERAVFKSWRPRGGAKQDFLKVYKVFLCRSRRGAPLGRGIRRGPGKEVQAGFDPPFVPPVIPAGFLAMRTSCGLELSLEVYLSW